MQLDPALSGVYPSLIRQVSASGSSSIHGSRSGSKARHGKVKRRAEDKQFISQAQLVYRNTIDSLMLVCSTALGELHARLRDKALTTGSSHASLLGGGRLSELLSPPCTTLLGWGGNGGLCRAPVRLTTPEKRRQLLSQVPSIDTCFKTFLWNRELGGGGKERR